MTTPNPKEVAEKFFAQDTAARALEYSKSPVACIERHLSEAHGHSVVVEPGRNAVAALHENAVIEHHRGFFDNCLREKGFRRDDLTGLWCHSDDAAAILAYAHQIWEEFGKKTYECGITGKQFLSHWKKWTCTTPSGCFVPSSPWEAEANMLDKGDTSPAP